MCIFVQLVFGVSLHNVSNKFFFICPSLLVIVHKVRQDLRIQSNEHKVVYQNPNADQQQLTYY